ncbi:ROK family transcriptional regulator [Cellulomonas fimi]|uniref:ROK family protein n=1 Tax=Cellulomonas fimi (strain ATCC 484 / DSM 20113 / JCM 1341 / CCUG 24087 / LMG 16345 / NBRC 15513 / NCIMB 8980 / NCTC 7547 / NRS-133) TaxID=590998 RepID=F4H3R8_CELFA|nr:ROK family transcriptional regulator [Cellulomonas fimi]AEE47734.1 ROK family protein [Cellulomonas fimi ATCC 484]NNH06727.1 ROK family transcriptional regulator [Cellulomonas fimi]VEH36897.1 Glucokinase [Cellulomonas fimi]
MAVRKRSSRDIRSESRLDVLHALLSLGESTRNELARRTGLSLATVATVVSELIGEGLVVEAGLAATGVGRPTTTLRINGGRGLIAGIDVAETYVSAHVFDAALAEVGTADLTLDEHETSAEYVVDAIVRALDEAVASTGLDRSRLLGVGVALPGLVQRSTGAMSVVVPKWSWRADDLIDLLRARVGLPLVVENPLKAIATAELWLGTGRGASSMVTINLGTGVGAGIVLEGTILRGATNSAGEWGHSLLVHDGRGCRCGRRGCVEAYVGAPGIQQTLREIAPDHPLADPDLQQRDVIGALASALDGPDPDPAVVETLDRTARYLGSAIADVVAIINPEVVMLTGWTAWALGEHLLPGTQSEIRTQSPNGAATDLTLGISTVRGNSAAIGMATLAFERFLGDVGLVTTRAPLAL